MKKKKIIIFAPDYNPDSGGAITTHKLCHLLNEMGREAYLFPLFDTHPINILNFESTLEQLNKELFHFSVGSTVNIENEPAHPADPPKELSFKERFQLARKILFPPKEIQVTEHLPIVFNPNRHSLKTNSSFITPCLDIRSAYEIADNDEYVVIYPEVVMGNPLKAKNVVRWLLHTPGFHTNQTNYGPNELYFRFSVETPYFSHPGSTTSDQFLTVVHFPTEIYNMDGASQDRQGTAYCIRKGAGKEIVHDVSDSICIDGKSHEEIAEIFKRVKTFYCYDTRTAYYYFASLCGCETIVIPDEGVSEEEWLPQPVSRVGIRYGIDSPKNWSQSTPKEVLNFLKAEEDLSILRVKNTLEEIDMIFDTIAENEMRGGAIPRLRN
jgi:hypothetical protein